MGLKWTRKDPLNRRLGCVTWEIAPFFESVANNGHLPLLLKSDDTNTHSGHTHTPRTRTRVHTQTHTCTHKHTHMIKHTQETQRPIQSKYSHTVCNQSGRMMPLAWLGGLGASALVVSACVGRCRTSIVLDTLFTLFVLRRVSCLFFFFFALRGTNALRCVAAYRVASSSLARHRVGTCCVVVA